MNALEILPFELWDLIFGLVWEKKDLTQVFVCRALCRLGRDLIDSLIHRIFGVESFWRLFDCRTSRLDFLSQFHKNDLNFEATLEESPMVMVEEWGPFFFQQLTPWTLAHWREVPSSKSLTPSSLLVVSGGHTPLSRTTLRLIDLTSEIRHRFPGRQHHSPEGWSITLGHFFPPSHQELDQHFLLLRIVAGWQVYFLSLCRLNFQIRDLVPESQFELSMRALDVLQHRTSNRQFRKSATRIRSELDPNCLYRHDQVLLGLSKESEGKLPLVWGRLPSSVSDQARWYVATSDEIHKDLGFSPRQPSSITDLRTGLSFLKNASDSDSPKLWFWDPFRFPFPSASSHFPGFRSLFPAGVLTRHLLARIKAKLSNTSAHLRSTCLAKNYVYLLETSATGKENWLLSLDELEFLISGRLRIMLFDSGEKVFEKSFFLEENQPGHWKHLAKDFPLIFQRNVRFDSRTLYRNPCWISPDTLHLGHISNTKASEGFVCSRVSFSRKIKKWLTGGHLMARNDLDLSFFFPINFSVDFP